MPERLDNDEDWLQDALEINGEGDEWLSQRFVARIQIDVRGWW